MKEKSECATHSCVWAVTLKSHSFIIRNWSYEKLTAIVGKKCLLKYNGIYCVQCFVAQSLLGHLANVMPRMAKERKEERKHLSGLSLAFILDEEACTVMCLGNYKHSD